MRAPQRPLLELGRLLITPGAQAALSNEDVLVALSRHARGDWGEADLVDAAENELSVREGLRVLSAYRAAADGTKFWVITEADRSLTTVLLPEEY
ncbi:MAG: hypothetical protein IT349_09015 [Candidatus Eisenbacteria bacterium]|nr:hypothetical protein [Candidatus Eisenbacteria bacterium]